MDQAAFLRVVLRLSFPLAFACLRRLKAMWRTTAMLCGA